MFEVVIKCSEDQTIFLKATNELVKYGKFMFLCFIEAALAACRHLHYGGVVSTVCVLSVFGRYFTHECKFLDRSDVKRLSRFFCRKPRV